MESKRFISRCEKEFVVAHLSDIDMRSDYSNSNFNLYFLWLFAVILLFVSTCVCMYAVMYTCRHVFFCFLIDDN